MKKILLYSILALALQSCVSSKIHKELQTKYTDLESTNSDLRMENEALRSEAGALRDTSIALRNELERARKAANEAGRNLRSLEEKHEQLNKNYEFLLESNNALMSSNQAENRRLMEKLNKLQSDLSAKEDSLLKEQEQLDYLSKELQRREARVNELEGLIAKESEKAAQIRNQLKKALFNFDGKGLSVEQRDGKVYVSLDNSLLFPSGSWEVNANGRKALGQLAEVLAENSDLNVMVEGHTDSDAFRGSTAVKDNWDLSVMRATAIVKIITSTKGVDPSKITAAGRSEYLPVADNDTAEGKAKNRRTEIIITPDLSEIVKVLGEVK